MKLWALFDRHAKLQSFWADEDKELHGQCYERTGCRFEPLLTLTDEEKEWFQEDVDASGVWAWYLAMPESLREKVRGLK